MKSYWIKYSFSNSMKEEIIYCPLFLGDSVYAQRPWMMTLIANAVEAD